MMLFEIKAPDGRTIRTPGSALAEVKARLVPGYEIVGRVIGADAAGKGGFVEPIGGPSLMKVLLDAHGDELVDWLRSRGGP